MFNTISLNRPSPKELAVSSQTARESTWGMKHPPKRPAPLPGWIRVKFYSHIYKIRYEMLPDMEGDVKLNLSGELDMKKVCQLWNLEACVAIDPMRWIPVESYRPRWLSALAVRVLSERNKCIMFIEPKPLSPSTAHKRKLREASIHLQTSISMLSHLSFSVTSSVVNTSVDFVGRGTAKVNRVWVYLDERTKFPMLTRYAVMPLAFIFSWIAMKTIASPAGRYVHSTKVSCKKRFKIAMASSHVLRIHEQMHWIVLSICLMMLIVGLLLLLNALGWNAQYRTMSLLRQPSVWAQRGENRGLMGARAV
ncbi:hypothetical protein J3R30DRAFT_1083925 [Lentinula aciculospora]|uniref:Uncharacterized protein n=1 Tax=Lentinula aciculospora TaxID=153920 RepID=A0A9W9A1P6_9AGAR|nr:hypothetical protein J3R30DRAFT_1083925 [Lentinula aciculospora]